MGSWYDDTLTDATAEWEDICYYKANYDYVNLVNPEHVASDLIP